MKHNYQSIFTAEVDELSRITIPNEFVTYLTLRGEERMDIHLDRDSAIS